MDKPLPPLKPEFLAMMAKGVSLMLCSCDPALTPSVMRAVGSRIEDEGRRITAYLGRAQAAQLLADIASSGRLAAVFSQPSTHLTVQFKSRRVRIRETRADDTPHLERYLRSMEEEVAAVGFAPVCAHALLAHAPGDLVAVEFEPDEAYDQTPGPQAGRQVSAH
ncbi:hypothetical protein [Hydrogenophaga sp. T2]|uniref:hypothetical protein n=1 Tax=Hydrogenophaga sp. T2 TaxID=3132823 RepID=UPI003CED3CE2